MNWKVLLSVAQIAMQVRTRIPAILFIVQLLKQFDRSLTNDGRQLSKRPTGKSGFVYVIRDNTNGERYKVGRRAKPPWRDSQLRKEMGQNGDFILVIPAKDAPALEKRLRQAYAKKTRKSDWFELDNDERRELLIIAALIQLVDGTELGMAEIDQDIVNVANDVLNKFQKLAKELWKKRRRAQKAQNKDPEPTTTEPDIDYFSSIPEMDWEWESVIDENYRDLPKAKGKSGYVCIIRDNDARRGKIFFHNHPVKSIEAAFLERPLRFPLEIVMILKTDRIRKAAESLLSQSERKDGAEWVELTQEELGEFRQSSKEQRTHGSLYLGPEAHWGLKTLKANMYRDYQQLKKPAGYVCVVQGKNPGKLYKIWETSRPKSLVEDRWQTRELNSLHDMLTARKPVKFHCIIRCEHAQSFREFLQERYHNQRRHKGWFEFKRKHVDEIKRLGR